MHTLEMNEEGVNRYKRILEDFTTIIKGFQRINEIDDMFLRALLIETYIDHLPLDLNTDDLEYLCRTLLLAYKICEQRKKKKKNDEMEMSSGT